MDAGEAIVAKFPTGEGQFFVKPAMVAPSDNQPRPEQHCWLTHQAVGDGSNGHTVELLGVFHLPDFFTQEPQTHLDEPVSEVRQHYVVIALRHSVVKGDRASFSGVRVLKPVRRFPPGTAEFWDGKDGRARPTRRVRWDQRRLFRKVKGNLDSSGDVRGRHVKLVLRLQERVVQSLNPLAQLPFPANESASTSGVGFC